MNKILSSIGAICIFGLITMTCAPQADAAAHKVTAHKAGATMEFRTSSITGKEVPHVRIIVIGSQGQILKTGLTNNLGNWRVTLPVDNDKRFKDVRDIGIVTAIAIADNYNERVVFEVPVFKHAVESIMLMPIRPNHRNEPTMTIGNIHRHDLAKFVNAYASQMGLKRQTAISGEADYAPWSPDTATSSEKAKGLADPDSSQAMARRGDSQ